MEYLQITKAVTVIVRFCRTGNDPQIIRNSRPFFVKTSNPGPIVRNHHHQQVGIGAVRGEHRTLTADLTPVPPCAGLAELAQVHGLLVAQGGLNREIFTFLLQWRGGGGLTSRLIPATS